MLTWRPRDCDLLDCSFGSAEMSLSWLGEELQALTQAGLRRGRRTFNRVPSDPETVETRGRRLLNFASNDYLGLAADPRVIAAAEQVLVSRGVGSGASALVSGRSSWHEQLESDIAKFEGTESAILFPSGYAANVGVVSALANEQDVIFCDRLNHASLIDGCRLSRASFRVYRHEELDQLERSLSRSTGFRRRFVVTDSVFSMDGDLAPMQELCDIAERYEAVLIVDEAHGTGVFGEHGRGVCELMGVENRVAIRIGTLSKAIGSLGGFVAGSQNLIDWLWNSARTQVFSTALPSACCAAASEAFAIIQREPERRVQLLGRSIRLSNRLRLGGHHVPDDVAGPIIPVILGDPFTAMSVAGILDQQGFLVGAIRPPTVPRGTSRLRMTLTAAHTENHIDSLADAVLTAIAGATAKGCS